MDQPKRSACTICGTVLSPQREAFAITQGMIEDRLRIYHWDTASARSGLQGACCTSHVRELVIHWMVTGNLNYPFANSIPNWETPRHAPSSPTAPEACANLPIGELAVDHDSVSRLLQNNPASLVVILDELNDALQRSLEENSEVLALASLSDDLIHRI